MNPRRSLRPRTPKSPAGRVQRWGNCWNFDSGRRGIRHQRDEMPVADVRHNRRRFGVKFGRVNDVRLEAGEGEVCRLSKGRGHDLAVSQPASVLPPRPRLDRLPSSYRQPDRLARHSSCTTVQCVSAPPCGHPPPCRVPADDKVPCSCIGMANITCSPRPNLCNSLCAGFHAHLGTPIPFCRPTTTTGVFAFQLLPIEST